MELLALPAFADNYIWLLHDGQHALAVDPGDAQVVEQALSARGLALELMLLTHHHRDHTGGVDALRARWPQSRVEGPHLPELAHGPVAPLTGGERLSWRGLRLDVMATPGHTLDHLSYVAWPERQAPLLFCGDTLFSAGCGRLFEGTPAQLQASLDDLAALPDSTRVCCAHEYTLANLRFAVAADPGNAEVRQYQQHCVSLRADGRPTLPSLLETELRINPFLRTQAPGVRDTLQARGLAATDRLTAFAALRQWKNEFR
ncbi:hydroxyacylglutathione hydrolase [Ideonella livida]|uniref:Hydroxyacylglutathione hydrolase n=1 Tax=Ideonella livida TaxID=2707176 RepID=A0A7C9THK6_9BURK|nr:hydroxyacylglutathione hydrolase [Ideonella livida]NDY90621.1 hydroxyacylglutathione hydrolase [Ideonella livida]